MRFKTQGRSHRTAAADVAIVAVREGRAPGAHPGLARLDAVRPFVAALFKATGFKGEADRTLVHQTLTKGLPARVVFVGLGKTEATTEEAYRRAGAFAARLIGDATEA